MLLLVNSTHLCQVTLDNEFNRLSVVTCVSVEPSLQVSQKYFTLGIKEIVISGIVMYMYMYMYTSRAFGTTKCVLHVSIIVLLQGCPD